MIYKSRKDSFELKIMKCLKKRMDFSKKEDRYYLNLVKGLEGEQSFDSMAGELTSDCLVLNDLLFKTAGTTFQIDSLIITGTSLLLYEIKNYEGEYLFQEERLKMASSNKEIINPLIQ